MQFRKSFSVATFAISLFATALPVWANYPPAAVVVATDTNLLKSTMPLFFAQDDRLKEIISLQRIVTGGELLRQMRVTSRRVIVPEVDALTYAAAPIAVACDGRSMASIMDALAAFHGAHWERMMPDGYRLIANNDGSDFTFLLDENGQVRRETGNQLVQIVNTLSPEAQATLRGESGAAFETLPDALQNLLQAMRRASDHYAQAIDRTNTLSARAGKTGNNLQIADVVPSPIAAPLVVAPIAADTRIRISADKRLGVASYYVTLRNTDGTGSSWQFNDADEKRIQYLAKIAEKGLEPRYDTTPSLTSADTTKTSDLRRPVKIVARQATLHQVLMQLHKTYGIDFLGNAPVEAQPQRRNVRLAEMPLAQALNELCALYDGATWELRPSGFLLVHIKTANTGETVITASAQ